MQKIISVKCPKCNNNHHFYKFGKDIALSHCVIGASETPSFGDDYDTLFSDAKKALLEAKLLPEKISLHILDKRKTQKNQ